MTNFAVECPVEIVSENLTVRFYKRDPNRVVVVFASAGAPRVDGFAEEFHGSLRDLGVSIVFVTDRHIRWYNYPDTREIFERIGDLVVPFRHVGVLGESLGASGSLLFTRFCPRVSRVLALVPQYSVAPPFIRFDGRYNYVGEKIERFYFAAFDECPVRDRCLVVFGNRSWRDYVHASMFIAAGFSTAFVDEAPHEISRFLKQSKHGNLLKELMEWFCDFDVPFSRESASAIQGYLGLGVR